MNRAAHHRIAVIDHGDPVVLASFLDGVMPVDQDATGRGAQLTGHETPDRGFADVVLARNGDDFARRHGQVRSGKDGFAPLRHRRTQTSSNTTDRRLMLGIAGGSAQVFAGRQIVDRSCDLLGHHGALDLVPGRYHAQQRLDDATGQHGAAGDDADRDLAVDRQDRTDGGGGDLRERGNQRREALRVVDQTHDAVRAAGRLLGQPLEAAQKLLLRAQRLHGDDVVEGLDQEVPHPGLGHQALGRDVAHLAPALERREAEEKEHDEGHRGEPAAAGEAAGG